MFKILLLILLTKLRYTGRWFNMKINAFVMNFKDFVKFVLSEYFLTVIIVL